MSDPTEPTDHAWTQEHAAAYLTGGLSVDESLRLEAHVRACAQCAAGARIGPPPRLRLNHHFAADPPGTGAGGLHHSQVSRRPRFLVEQGLPALHAATARGRRRPALPRYLRGARGLAHERRPTADAGKHRATLLGGLGPSHRRSQLAGTTHTTMPLCKEWEAGTPSRSSRFRVAANLEEAPPDLQGPRED